MKIINKFTGKTIEYVGDANSLKEAVNKVGFFLNVENPREPDVLIQMERVYYSEDLQLVADDWNEEVAAPWDIASDAEKDSFEKINNVKKAVHDYDRANGHGKNSTAYGNLMFDMALGDVWTDEYADGNSYTSYSDKDIINLGNVIRNHGFKITENSVKYYANKYLKENQK